MKGKSIFKKRKFAILVLLLIIFYFGPTFLGGYYWTEKSAIRNVDSIPAGKVIFEKEFKNKKVVVWDTGQIKYVRLIENNFWFLYRSTSVSGIDGETSDEKMKTTWLVSQGKDALFAAEILDEDIVKVIVSNEANLEGENLSFKEVKEQSSLFVEMDVKDGVAAQYTSLLHSESINFVFRGVNADGNDVSTF
ncbi:hypothetical protein NC661_03980 [Aquibacillus koreensis]|uniref:Uncharacterized protein n=1 Tax=Aquibacillus koreensis TaxID=279446 RepID=A0A9X3WJ53_9BACI|nr:hypothetical protein [Aquibacillus koreensis]MCT2534869.1 hypothetical protein [Aquibacillus koreensis]MDC3419520.1 hypothetical protein [Aquibacillus koreensis]